MPTPPDTPPSRYHALKERVLNRGVPPDAFLDELVAWGGAAPDDIFVPNAVDDVYSSVVGVLGPWRDLNHRRAAMLEVMRVLAGFEILVGLERGPRYEQPDVGHSDHH